MESRIFKNVRHRGNRTPIYKESTRKLTQPFQIPNKSALTTVRTFSRTKIYAKRFLSRSGSPQKFLERGKPNEASLHTKRLSPQGVFSHEASLHKKASLPAGRFLTRSVSSYEASLPTGRFLTRSSPSHMAFHHSATSPTAHSDELLYPAQATTPQELDLLRPRRHPATAP